MLPVCLVIICLFLLIGCLNEQDKVSTDNDQNNTSVQLSIGFTSGNRQIIHNAIGQVTDIVSINVAVSEVGKTSSIGQASLEQNGATGNWEGTINNLPPDIDLDFTAEAYNTTPEVIFTGSVTASLTSGGPNTIQLYMQSVDDGGSSVPTVESISYGIPILENSTNNEITFTFQNTDGPVNYNISANAGSVSPSSGSHDPIYSLQVYYNAPSEPTTDYITISIKDPDLSYTSSVTYDVPVYEAVSGGITLKFGPAITNMNFHRSSDQLEITAVVDPPTGITYSWSGTGSFDSVTESTNTLTLNPFSDTDAGDITISATNLDGISAFVTRPIAANDFPYSAPGASMGDDVNIIFLHHSTGGFIWGGGVSSWFETYNANNSTNYSIVDREYPKGSPYGWYNDPYDYWNIWVNHAGAEQYMEEDTLEILTQTYDVIVWKHCYSVSVIHADSYGDPPDVTLNAHAVDIYQAQYNALKTKMHSFPATRFIVWTGAAKVQASEPDEEQWATRARTFAQWIINDWDEPDDNIFVFDFRQIQTNGGLYFLDEYSLGPGDSHPGYEFSDSVAPHFSQRIVDVIEGNGDNSSLTGGWPLP